MHSISKAFFGAVFVLSPLSAAMAEDAYQLPVITNTVANLVEQDDQKTLAAVTVIDRAEIERKQFNSLQDLLRTVPGVTYSNTGGLGKVTSVSIRGTGNRHALVLVDGQKVGSATLGETAFEHFPIDQIERVEVLRGPRSSLYGSEAIGGVIQIFTRKGTQNGVKPFASFTYGSHETYQGNVGLNIRQNDTWATLNVAGTKTQGIDATNINEANDLDKDGYENKSASLRMGHKFNDQFDIDASVLVVDGENEYDSKDLPWSADAENVHSKIEQNIYSIGATYKPFDLWTTQLRLGRSEDKLDSRDNYPSVINTQRDSLSWLNTLNFNKQNTLMLGFDYQNDEVSGTKAYAVKERDNKAYFAQYLGSFGSFDVQGAVRQDDNEQFGNHTTGSATLGYRFNEAVQSYVSYGTAFKAPTFNDLYWPGSENPTLVPEESENYEIGFKGVISNVQWELNGFYNEIENMIVWAPNASGNYVPSNVDKAKIKGAELSLTQQLNDFVWNVNYTYQEPENETAGSNGKQLLLKPTQIFNASADYTMEKWTVGASVHAEDKRYTNAANTAELGSFATVDTRVTYQATPEFSVQAKLANMFDKEYSTNYSNSTLFNQEGRTAWLTLRYAMK
ncbi:TonB-dependent vitamin B12 receptor [Acinetobacter bouvetii DSM 14964 = CIP 107468]|jgi:vitamin B12 transporter|uniref:TonB-dependent vitamin B12 receptor n=1 Tax=Acinetobacter bouvetii DSM 14964 = CIP 107468 TaxID=1120925 RepID=N9DMN2_9GAMM|nr:TonB-dependent receptor [Acinetobacter bouvetii]ENV81733.1 TonB-dependent vitamin B12 receptor [Acinetobacter bouvetii DSM 14964 = CIP 107468]BCU63814.1 TonB-dependent receptor [Acinetobacter bouvetii]